MYCCHGPTISSCRRLKHQGERGEETCPCLWHILVQQKIFHLLFYTSLGKKPHKKHVAHRKWCILQFIAAAAAFCEWKENVVVWTKYTKNKCLNVLFTPWSPVDWTIALSGICKNSLYVVQQIQNPATRALTRKKETKQYFTELDIPALATLFFFFFELITKSHWLLLKLRGA